MRRAALALAALALVAGACGGDDDSTSASPTDSSAGGDPIRVGAWFPLTGAIASNGVPQSQGASAYFDLINDRGGVNGRKIEFIFEDNAFDPQRTITIARKLVEQDDVDVIACANGTPHTEATFPFVLDHAGIPIFGTYGGLVEWYEPPRENLYGLQTPFLPDHMDFIVDWIEDDGHRRVSIVVDEIEVYVNQAAYLEEVLPTRDIEFDIVRVATGTKDWSPAAGDVAKFDPDATIVLASIPETVGYLQEARRQQIESDVYLVPASANQSVLDLAGKAATGVKAAAYNPPGPGKQVPGMKELLAAHDKYASDADVTPDFIWSFACAKTLVEVLGRVEGELTAESFADAVYTLENYETGGLFGPISFGPDRHAGQRALVRLEEANGRWKQVSEFINTEPTDP